MGADSERTEAEGETWARRAAARQRQIDIGKARPEYQRYEQLVPLAARKPGMPKTPDPYEHISKRAFDRQLSLWRRRLHECDAGGGDRKDGAAVSCANQESPATDSTHIGSEDPFSPDMAGSSGELEERAPSNLLLSQLLPPASLCAAPTCPSPLAGCADCPKVCLAPPAALHVPGGAAAGHFYCQDEGEDLRRLQMVQFQEMQQLQQQHQLQRQQLLQKLEQQRQLQQQQQGQQQQQRCLHNQDTLALPVPCDSGKTELMQTAVRERHSQGGAFTMAQVGQLPGGGASVDVQVGEAGADSSHREQRRMVQVQPASRKMPAIAALGPVPPQHQNVSSFLLPVGPENMPPMQQVPSIGSPVHLSISPTACMTAQAGVSWQANSVLVPSRGVASPDNAGCPSAAPRAQGYHAFPAEGDLSNVNKEEPKLSDRTPHTPPKRSASASLRAMSPLGWASPSAAKHLDTPSPEQHPHRYEDTVALATPKSSMARRSDEGLVPSPQATQVVQVTPVPQQQALPVHPATPAAVQYAQVAPMPNTPIQRTSFCSPPPHPCGLSGRGSPSASPLATGHNSLWGGPCGGFSTPHLGVLPPCRPAPHIVSPPAAMLTCGVTSPQAMIPERAMRLVQGMHGLTPGPQPQQPLQP
mmetsp:Transcript_20387/g.37093  ORF Transcript_20387/g.37093 Transcript_20387/m.37093 type:complete len:641 (+) Transcript_20387:58-1980(+)